MDNENELFLTDEEYKFIYEKVDQDEEYKFIYEKVDQDEKYDEDEKFWEEIKKLNSLEIDKIISVTKEYQKFIIKYFNKYKNILNQEIKLLKTKSDNKLAIVRIIMKGKKYFDRCINDKKKLKKALKINYKFYNILYIIECIEFTQHLHKVKH